MIKKITKTLTAYSTWAASSDLTPVVLPTDGLITEITIRANITATLTAAAYDDWFRRVIQNIRIEGDSSRAFLGMAGTQMSTVLSLFNEVTSGAPTLVSNGAGIALSAPDVGSTAFKSIFKIHPGSIKNDPFDTTAVIPAIFLSNLQASLTTTAAAVTDAAGPISAGTFNYEVNMILGTRDELRNYCVMQPVGATLVHNHSGDFSAYSDDIDIPGGAFLRSIIMRVTDDTATVPRRKNDEVTGLAIKKSLDSTMLLQQSIYEAQMSMAQRFGCPGVAGDVGPIGAIATIRPGPVSLQSMLPAGFVIIDLRPYDHPVYGLDLRNYKTGDLKLGLTVENYAAGDATTIYWDQLLPINF